MSVKPKVRTLRTVENLPSILKGQSYADVRSETITLTPEVAFQLLESIDKRKDVAIKQRSLNERAIKSYAEQMRGGKWAMNGEPLILSDKGYLMDGQHRCWAVIESNTSIEVLLTVGVSESHMDTIDQNRVRSHSDVLSMTGMTKTLSSILATAGQMELRFRHSGTPLSSSKTITPKDVRMLMQETPNLVSCGEWINSVSKKSNVYTKSHLAWLQYRFTLVDGEFSQGWLDDLITGANLTEADPRLWIRNKVNREADKRAKTKPEHRLTWVVAAWQRDRIGRLPKNEGNFLGRLSPAIEFKHLLMPGERGYVSR